ncbi:hypothetical protein [Microbispora sp. H11081]|uniref:hypothetical protein n=1 Tax=Microbispora sp. H11081 TaxID=2729107 RepID=UPI0014749D2C|nr:hypothetical protein [Microbispora sp. H11081]
MNGRDSGARAGRTVHRIRWVPGTDRLHASCFCGAEREFEDPVVLWDWLLGHPEGHRPGGAEARDRDSPAPAAVLV